MIDTHVLYQGDVACRAYSITSARMGAAAQPEYPATLAGVFALLSSAYSVGFPSPV